MPANRLVIAGAMLGAGALLLVAAACGGSSGSNEDTTTEAPAGGGTLRVNMSDTDIQSIDPAIDYETRAGRCSSPPV